MCECTDTAYVLIQRMYRCDVIMKCDVEQVLNEFQFIWNIASACNQAYKNESARYIYLIVLMF